MLPLPLVVSILLVTAACIPGFAQTVAEDTAWNSRSYRLEFKYFIEKNDPSEALWNELDAETRLSRLYAAGPPAEDRFQEISEFYAVMMRKWTAENAQGNVNAVTQKLDAVSLWLGDEKAGRLSAKRDRVRAMMDNYTNGQLTDADLLTAQEYMAPQVADDMRVLMARQVQTGATTGKNRNLHNKPASVGKLDTLSREGGPGGSTDAANKFFDGGGQGRDATAPTVSINPHRPGTKAGPGGGQGNNYGRPNTVRSGVVPGPEHAALNASPEDVKAYPVGRSVMNLELGPEWTPEMRKNVAVQLGQLQGDIDKYKHEYPLLSDKLPWNASLLRNLEATVRVDRAVKTGEFQRGCIPTQDTVHSLISGIPGVNAERVVVGRVNVPWQHKFNVLLPLGSRELRNGLFLDYWGVPPGSPPLVLNYDQVVQRYGGFIDGTNGSLRFRNSDNWFE